MLRPVVRILPAIAILVLSLSSYGKVFLNSSCHLEPGKSVEDIKGDKNKGTKYPLASISKVVTTLWAMKTLGPNFTFDTQIHVTPNSDKTVDVHIQGSRNPYFGQRMGYLLISELNAMGVKHVRNLTFDNNFLLSWNVETEAVAAGDTKTYSNISDQIADVKKYINGALLTPVGKKAYAALRKNAAADLGIKMVENADLSADNVDFIAATDFKRTDQTRTYIFSSAPLKDILKKMNNQSNNYIADHLYWNLGGTIAFNAFVQQMFAKMKDEVIFENGSGNNFGTDEKPAYNQASCEFMVNAMVELKKTAEAANLRLSDLMAVAGVDTESTVKNWGGVMEDAAVLKTGSVYKAKTLTGALATKSGIVYFAILYHTDRDANSSDWNKANALIKDDVEKMFSEHSGRKALGYDEVNIYPFGKNSGLRPFSVNLKLASNTDSQAAVKAEVKTEAKVEVKTDVKAEPKKQETKTKVKPKLSAKLS